MIRFLKWFTGKFENNQHRFCSHNYILIDDWQSDALGIPYGYKTYECSKCKHVDKRFWYI